MDWYHTDFSPSVLQSHHIYARFSPCPCESESFEPRKKYFSRIEMCVSESIPIRSNRYFAPIRSYRYFAHRLACCGWSSTTFLFVTRPVEPVPLCSTPVRAPAAAWQLHGFWPTCLLFNPGHSLSCCLGFVTDVLLTAGRGSISSSAFHGSCKVLRTILSCLPHAPTLPSASLSLRIVEGDPKGSRGLRHRIQPGLTAQVFMTFTALSEILHLGAKKGMSSAVHQLLCITNATILAAA